MIAANTCCKSPKVVASVSKSRRLPKPNFRVAVASKTSLIGTFLPSLATLPVDYIWGDIDLNPEIFSFV